MRASIRRVAEVAGVSSMTVSNVLNNRTDQMTAETLRRVLSTIHDLNYVPVRSAQQNRHVRTNAIGVVFLNLHAPDSAVGYPTFLGMCRQARRIDNDLTIFLRSEPNWVRKGSEQQFLDRRCDGFIFVGANKPAISEALVRQKVPVVECYSVDPAPGVARVLGDNIDAMRQAVAHLAAAGHTRIAHLGGPREHLEAQERVAGFRAAIRDTFGADHADYVVEGETWGNIWRTPEAGAREDARTRRLSEAVLAMEPTAVVCANDSLAFALWQLAEERGLSVPEDLSITGMDDIPESAHRGLTSLSTPFEKVGEAAVDAVFGLQRGSESAEVSRVLQVTFVSRGSVGPPRVG